MMKDDLAGLAPKEAYRAIARHLIDAGRRTGSRTLPAPQLQLTKAVLLHEEIRNGGIAQYFTNGFGKELPLAIEGLRSIGANLQVDIISKWLRQLPAGLNPEDRSQVGVHLFSKLESGLTPSEQLEHLDSEYFKNSESFCTALVDYVRRNPSVAGFTKG